MNFLSSGPDKKFGTDDDIQASGIGLELLPAGFKESFKAKLALFRSRVGRDPETAKELETILRDSGWGAGRLSDPWGHPYSIGFHRDGPDLYIALFIDSIPPVREGLPSTGRLPAAYLVGARPYSSIESRIAESVDRFFRVNKYYPRDLGQLAVALGKPRAWDGGLDDPLGATLRVVVDTRATVLDSVNSPTVSTTSSEPINTPGLIQYIQWQQVYRLCVTRLRPDDDGEIEFGRIERQIRVEPRPLDSKSVMPIDTPQRTSTDGVPASIPIVGSISGFLSNYHRDDHDLQLRAVNTWSGQNFYTAIGTSRYFQSRWLTPGEYDIFIP